MSTQNKSIETRFLKNTVINNLLDRKKVLNDKFKKNKEYWALQLLYKLGLLDQDRKEKLEGEEEDETTDAEPTLDAVTRNAKLREMGIFLSKDDLNAINRELKRIADEANK